MGTTSLVVALEKEEETSMRVLGRTRRRPIKKQTSDLAGLLVVSFLPHTNCFVSSWLEWPPKAQVVNFASLKAAVGARRESRETAARAEEKRSANKVLTGQLKLDRCWQRAEPALALLQARQSPLCALMAADNDVNDNKL